MNGLAGLPEEEQKRIMALPMRTFRVGGGTKSGRYDEAAHKFYETDEEGTPTGKVATVNIPAPRPPKPAEPEAPDEDDQNEDDVGEDAPKQGFFTKHKLLVILGGSVVGLILILVLAMALGGNGGDVSVDEPGVETAEPLASEVVVLRVNADLLPGHILAEEDMEEVTISREEYEQTALNGRALYQVESKGLLLGNYLSKYVPAGQYLEQDNVQASSPFPMNPYMRKTEGTTFIDVPVDAELAENAAFTYGSALDLTIRKVTSNEVAVGGNGEDVVDGVIHTTTVDTTNTIEEFTIGSLYVCDLLDSNGNSLYEFYYSYTAIPLGKRLEYLTAAMKKEPELYDILTPAYVKVRVTEAQAAAIGDPSEDDVTAILHTTENTYAADNDQARLSAETTSVRELVVQAQETVEQEKAQKQQELEAAMKEAEAKKDKEATENG